MNAEPDDAPLPPFVRMLDVLLEEFILNISCDSDGQKEQDLRGLSIAFACSFVPDLISESFRARLTAFVTGLKLDPQCDWEWWGRIPSLEVALFAITGDRRWLKTVIANIDHEQSGTRIHIMHALAMVAPRIDFTDEEIRYRIGNNLGRLKFFTDLNIVWLALTHGERSEKQEQFELWRLLYGEDLNKRETSALEALVKGNIISENPFYDPLRDLLVYVTQRCAEIAGWKESPRVRDRLISHLRDSCQANPLFQVIIEPSSLEL